MSREIFVENRESNVLTNATSVVLSDIGAAYGIREKVSGDVVVAAGTATVNTATGVYEYNIDALDTTLIFEYVFKITRINGDIEYVAGEIPIVVAGSNATYETTDEADTYFEGRLDSEPWDDATSANQTKALIQATRMIDKLNFKGEMTDEDQDLQFPRDDDSAVPQDIKDACSELALALLDGVDPELEVDNLMMVSQGYSNVRSTYDRTVQPENIAAQIPSVAAWRYLKPYLRDVNSIDLSRVS